MLKLLHVLCEALSLKRTSINGCWSTHMVLLLQYAVLNLTVNMLVFSKEYTFFLVVLVGFQLDIANIVLL
jgi:hypothetical protein